MSILKATKPVMMESWFPLEIEKYKLAASIVSDDKKDMNPRSQAIPGALKFSGECTAWFIMLIPFLTGAMKPKCRTKLAKNLLALIDMSKLYHPVLIISAYFLRRPVYIRIPQQTTIWTPRAKKAS